MPCFPSLAHAEKNSSALQGRWPAGSEGVPTTLSFRTANKRGVTALLFPRIHPKSKDFLFFSTVLFALPIVLLKFVPPNHPKLIPRKK